MTGASTRAAKPGLIVAICFGIAALEGYDIQAFGVAAPHMAPELGLGPAQLGWAGSAAMIGLVIGALFGGWAADRYGRRPVLLGSVALFGMFSLATALATNFETLTLAPMDRRLIVVELLSPQERAQMDAYHARVLAVVGPRIEQPEVRAWLEAACAPL